MPGAGVENTAKGRGWWRIIGLMIKNAILDVVRIREQRSMPLKCRPRSHHGVGLGGASEASLIKLITEVMIKITTTG